MVLNYFAEENCERKERYSISIMQLPTYLRSILLFHYLINLHLIIYSWPVIRLVTVKWRHEKQLKEVDTSFNEAAD